MPDEPSTSPDAPQAMRSREDEIAEELRATTGPLPFLAIICTMKKAERYPHISAWYERVADQPKLQWESWIKDAKDIFSYSPRAVLKGVEQIVAKRMIAPLLDPLDALPHNPDSATLTAPLRAVAKAIVASGADQVTERYVADRVDWALTAAGVSDGKKRLADAIKDARKKGTDAAPAADLGPAELEAERERRQAELEEQAAPVLAHLDPLELIKAELPEIGYGGDAAPVMITVLAAVSALLDVFSVPGASPCHLEVLGDSGGGKSFGVNTARKLFPTNTWTDAGGSLKSLIHEPDDAFRHKVLFFAEMDSIPGSGKGASDDANAVASAHRGLLSEHRFVWKTVLPIPLEDGGGHETVKIEKVGPTCMITTGVRPMSEQLNTRAFVYRVNTEPGELRVKLAKAAENEARRNTRPPSPALVALQAYLQHLAPWHVVVPFAEILAAHAAQSPEIGPRILRDFHKILALVKAVTILRHRHRTRDAAGRWIATIADYRFVFDLVREMYLSTTSGVSNRVREVVEVVEKLYAERRAATPVPPTSYLISDNRVHGAVNASQVAEELGTSVPTATRYIEGGLAGGWLINLAEYPRVSRRAFQLIPGEPLPPPAGLLPPDRIPPRRTPLVIPEEGFNPLTNEESGVKTDSYQLNGPSTDSERALTDNYVENNGEKFALKRLSPISPLTLVNIPTDPTSAPRSPLRAPHPRPAPTVVFRPDLLGEPMPANGRVHRVPLK